MSGGGGAPPGGGGAAGLRRDLGTLQSYAALVGMLIGAGIFSVIRDAWLRSGPGVLVGYLVLAPVVLATSIPYAVFLSTPLGRLPGGEYTHVSRTLRSPLLAFLGAWLKIISYVGALAFLAGAFADYLVALLGAGGEAKLSIALGGLAFFLAVHALGVRWFGRLQVSMCAILGVSILALVLPGVFAVRAEHLAPLFPRGFDGFAACLPALFFAYAGFESLAQAAGEVEDSTRRLPRVFLWGISGTTVIYFLLSLVIVGTLPPEQMQATRTPAADAAAIVLPGGLSWVVTLGALMALATSLNATMFVPSRLALMLAGDGLAPRWVGAVHAGTGTPIAGLLATAAAAALLLVSGQLSLGLNIAVFALVLLYFLHSLAFLLLPAMAPDLHAQAGVRLRPALHVGVAVLSMLALAALVVFQVAMDVAVLARTTLAERCAGGTLTSLELAAAWSAVGLALYARRRGGADSRPEPGKALR